MEKTGAVAEMRSVKEIATDEKNKIVTAPCYMMEASVSEVRENIRMAVNELIKLIG
jgi:enhancing lycopene biosynthesis protein 2